MFFFFFRMSFSGVLLTVHRQSPTTPSLASPTCIPHTYATTKQQPHVYMPNILSTSFIDQSFCGQLQSQFQSDFQLTKLLLQYLEVLLRVDERRNRFYACPPYDSVMTISLLLCTAIHINHLDILGEEKAAKYSAELKRWHEEVQLWGVQHFYWPQSINAPSEYNFLVFRY